MKKPDRIWGIERDRDSDAYGQLVVPVAYLWKSTAGVMEADNLSGALEHASRVYITKRKSVDGALWCRVEGKATKDGVVYPQVGWMRASVLFKAGK